MLNSRLDLLSDYPFRRLAALLSMPAGIDQSGQVIMSIGEPQQSVPAFALDILSQATSGWGKYPPMAGTNALRQASVDWLNRRFALPQGVLDPAIQAIPVAGTREGLFQIAQIVVDEAKDKKGRPPVVLLPNPFYQVYVGAAVMAGAEPVFVPATRENGFLPDFSTVPDDVLDRACLAYLCTPANPQGSVATLDSLKNSVALARRHGFVLAVDECYCEIYDRTAPAGGLQAAVALGGEHPLANVVVFHSLSKRSSAPGLRSGFAAGDPAIVTAFSRLRSYGGASMPFPVQEASAALWRDDAHVEATRALYRQRFDVAGEIIGKRFGFYRPAGGFYLWLDVGDGEAAAKALWTQAGIRVLPGAYLARPGSDGVNPGARYIRIALVHDLATTRRALSRLADVLS